jgi:hypothetical protein
VLARCWSEQVVHKYLSRSLLSHICFFKQAFLIPSISLNLNRNISIIPLALRHNIYLLELKPKHTNNTASFASCPELHTEILTVRVVWEQTFLIKKMIYISILWIFHVFQLHLHIDSQLKGCSSISVACRWFSG